MRSLVRFLTVNPVGRQFTFMVHRWPLHPGAGVRPLRFSSTGCWLCRQVATVSFSEISRGALMDRSRLELRTAEYNEDGSLKTAGVYMNATVKRQLDEIMANDPEAAKAINEAIDEISAE